MLAGLAVCESRGQGGPAVAGAPDVRAVAARLTDADYHVRWRSAYAIAQIGPPAKAAVPQLVAQLKDERFVVRWYALFALGRIGPGAADAVPAILEAMQDPKTMQDPQNHRYLLHIAAQALGRIGPEAAGAEATLRGELKSSDLTYRVKAAVALWQISRHPDALPVVLAVLRTGQGDEAFQAAMGLLEFGADAQTAIPDLVAALASADPDVRRAAVKVLGSLGTDVVLPICTALEANRGIDHQAAADALGLVLADVRTTIFYNPATSQERFLEIAAPLHRQVVPVLGRLLSDPQPEVRTSAARAWLALGPSTVQALLSALRSDNPQTREAALDGLQRLESCLPQGAPVSPGVEEIKRRSLKALMETLQHDDAEVRQAALRVFAALEIGSYGREAVPLLRPFLRHEDALVRRNAARCIDRIQTGESP